MRDSATHDVTSDEFHRWVVWNRSNRFERTTGDKLVQALSRSKEMHRSWLGVQRIFQVGFRSHSTLVYGKATIYGPYYRWERKEADNTDAIVRSKQLKIGRGIAGRTDGVYSFSRPTEAELADLRRGGHVIEFYAPQPAYEPNALHSGSRAVVWPEEKLGYESLPIQIAAVYGERSQTVYDEELHAVAKAELAKLRLDVD